MVQTGTFRASLKKTAVLCMQIHQLLLEDAINQMTFSKKYIATVLKRPLLQIRSIAVSKGWDPKKVWLSQVYVNRKQIIKGLKIHGRGRCGVLHIRHVNVKIHFTQFRESKPLRVNLRPYLSRYNQPFLAKVQY
jgi:ribosomal protein L22